MEEYWPYFQIARSLAPLRRKSKIGNQFRHSVDAFGILIEYGYSESILLKASIIHDIVEDGPKVGFHRFTEIQNIDTEGAEVLKLVKEVSRKISKNGKLEQKGVFLGRIMHYGSRHGKALKLADRIANLSDLAYISIDTAFAARYLEETRVHILPFAESINKAMSREMNELLHMNTTQLKIGV